MKKILFLFFIAFAFHQSNYAQSDEEVDIYSKADQTHLGIGIGLTYGTLGGRLTYSPSENLGLMLGLGYNTVSVAYNIGIMYYIPASEKTQVYFSGMFGTNAAIKVSGLSQLDESYNGVSFGFGVLLNSRANPGNYWDLGILVPVRSSDFNDDWDTVKNAPGILVEQDPWPILINIGYNFKI